jgi:hypothetical protein
MNEALAFQSLLLLHCQHLEFIGPNNPSRTGSEYLLLQEVFPGLLPLQLL